MHTHRIKFFYDGILSEEATILTMNTTSTINSYAMTYAGTYAIADKYEAPTLKDVALQRFQDLFEGDVSEALFKTAVQVVYHEVALPASDRSLRNVVVKAWLHGIATAKSPRDWMCLQKLCRDDEEFREDVKTRLFEDFLQAGIRQMGRS